MPRLAPAYRGPAAVIGVGGCFSFVGTVPVAITLGLGLKTSATVIGVGFMGFGVMLILPGICWCLAVQRRRSAWWRGRGGRGLGQGSSADPEADAMQTPALSDHAVTSYGGTENGGPPNETEVEVEPVAEYEPSAKEEEVALTCR